ncbi:MAG: hypothetical protein ABI557_13950 [Aureliella sp.]
MKSSQRNLWIGLAGLAVLLVSILVYAQVNATRNFDLGAQPQTRAD